MRSIAAPDFKKNVTYSSSISMRIGLLIPYLREPAGGEMETLHIAIALQKAGHDVVVYAHNANAQKCFPELFSKVKVKSAVGVGSVQEGLHARRRPLMRFLAPMRPYYELFMMRQLARIVDSDREILLATNQPAHWAAASAARRLHIPWVWICNEPPFYHDPRIPKTALQTSIPYPIYALHDRRAAKSAYVVFSLSHAAKPYIDAVYGVDSRVAHLPLMPGSRSYPRRQKAKNKSKRPFRVLFISTFTFYKRPQDAIEAMRYLPHARLDLIGQGILQKELEEQISRLGLSGRVRLVPRVDDKRLAQYYADADAFLCLAEAAWSLVGVDAMERGVPLILCQGCGLQEILREGKDAFIVPDRNPKAIADQLRWMAANPREADAMARQAKITVRKLDMARYLPLLLQGLRDALSSSPPKPHPGLRAALSPPPKPL